MFAAQSAQIGYAVSDLYPRFGLGGAIDPSVSTATGQEFADLSMEQYQDGLVDFNTVVNTLQALVSQQDQLASIQGTVAVNLVEVYNSLGGGWENRQGKNAGDLIPAETREEMSARGDYWPRENGK